MEQANVEALITERLIAFYDELVRRGQIPPAPEPEAVTYSGADCSASLDHFLQRSGKAASGVASRGTMR